MIPVTKPYMPSKERYKEYVDQIYNSNIFTNRGPLVQELESRLARYLGVKHVIAVANGSLALQVAYKSLNLSGDVITTPFSFVATSSTLEWEGLQPVFVDIDPETFNLDPELIEQKITKNTTAILPVHVFGNPCDVRKIDKVAKKHNLKVIYDAAHAFGVNFKGRSILQYGDISTVSFHATKLFHTIEGGAIITNCDHVAKEVRSRISFCIGKDGMIDGVGTNAKMNEFEAAMGLCVLDDIEKIVNKRKSLISEYRSNLPSCCQYQKKNAEVDELVSYMPVIFPSEKILLNVINSLNNNGVFPRRYFYPSLDQALCSELKSPLQISNDISSRILCLPLYNDLNINDVKNICGIIKDVCVGKGT